MQENVPIYLITRWLSGEATPEERETLEIWLQQSPENVTLFKEHDSLWTQVRVSEKFKSDHGLAKINQRIDAYEKLHATRQSISPFLLYKIAASFIAVGLTVSLLFWFSNSIHTENQLSWTEIKTTAGSQQKIVLSDSSHVQINGRSALYYPEVFEGESREVYLTGEAYFKIAPDKQHPFILHTGDFTTQVLGTAFNVKSDSGAVVVSVIEGIVKVFVNQDTAILYAGEGVVYTKDKNNIKKTKADLEVALAWMSRSLILQDETLGVVADKIYQLYGVTSEFKSQRMREVRITGKYRKMSLQDILYAIGFSTGANITYHDKHIIWNDAQHSTTNQ